MEKKCIKINNIKLSPDSGKQALEQEIRKNLRLARNDEVKYEIAKRSLDCRHKPDVMYIYSVEVFKVFCAGKEEKLENVLKRAKCRNAVMSKRVIYTFPELNVNEIDKIKEEKRPVIIGFGPSGIFCALELAKAGLCPVVYERGMDVDTRTAKVEEFWKTGVLDEECNVQFGEGGAGTFSDGKLNTQISDTYGRIRYVLDTFVQFGADPKILYVNKPHIGTDVLAVVIKNIRNEIIRLGGDVNFGCCLKGIEVNDGCVFGVSIRKCDGTEFIRKCSNVCLAIGHSARDTFEYLHGINIAMEPKPFAVGVRIEHSQALINNNAYADAQYELPAADYKVTYKTEKTDKPRGVYSFCMCPGGFVVNASSENERLAVNGMSYSGRDGKNANSAIIVTVGPEDFGNGVLDGIRFQQKLEKAAYREGNGCVPVQLFGDFENNITTKALKDITPDIKGKYRLSNLRNVLPEYISEALIEGIHGFDRYIHGFSNPDAVLSGVESRTSSPVRIVRDERLESCSLSGLFPCGEGAGYAGGITSAAVDGVRVAEKMACNMDFLQKI